MKIPMVIGDIKHGCKVTVTINEYEVTGKIHIHLLPGGESEIFLIHNNPECNGGTPYGTNYPFECGVVFSWYVGAYPADKPINECCEEVQSIRLNSRSRDATEKSQVIINHNRLLGALGRTSRNPACSPEAQSAARMIAKEIKQRKDLMIGFSVTEEEKLSYAAKHEHRMDTVRRVKTSFGRIVSRQLSVNIPDHVLAEVSGSIMVALSPYEIEEFKGEELTDVYAACRKISGLSSCMSHDREQVCLYEENPDNVSIITARTRGRDLTTLAARAMVFKTDSGKRMISRIYSLGDAPKTALKNWAENAGVEDCYNGNGKETLTLKFASNNYMPYMDSFRCYNDDEPTPGCDITFKASGRYSAESTEGTHAGNDRCTCDSCGDRMDEDDSFYVQCEDQRICQSCYDNDYFCCEHCGEYFPSDRQVNVDGNYYCSDCAPEYVTCEHCGDNISVNKGDYVCVEDEYYCTQHAPDHCECEGCNENVKDENITDVDGKHYCPDCVPEHLECESCGENFTETVEVDGKFYCDDCKPEPEEKEDEEEMAVA